MTQDPRSPPTPAALRAALLCRLKARCGADVAVFYDLLTDPDTGVVRCGQIVVDGPPEAHALLGGMEGIVFEELGVSLDEGPDVNAWCIADATRVSEAVRAGLWTPLGIRSAIGALFADEDALLGGVDLYRLGASPPFGPEELAACHVSRDETLGVARAALALARTSARGRRMVLDAEGRVIFSSSSGADGDPDLPRLKQHVSHMLQGDEAHVETFLGRDRVSLTRMKGSEGEAVALVITETLPGMSIPPTLRLSYGKRRVAALAAVGCTIDEIAEELGRSAHTVRSQLRAVYAELGVANRAELTRLVEQAWVRGGD
ncbi:MAG: helix-turn-helix transcriptional regulator [Alphaproteobacteria bacterium]|nr:helix-turn-helix transcriptional regulator [Alphaproteobacteria bacterium]